MMKKYAMIAFVPMFAAGAMAQDTYDVARFASTDLNGTARYVGMGGALSALGGDISVMGTNPAGAAMFRRSDAAFTFSGVFTDQSALGHDKARASVDNAGVVVAMNLDNSSPNGVKYINLGVNYVKKSNYLSNLVTGIDHLNNTFSQTFQIADLANSSYNSNTWGMLADMGAPAYNNSGTLTKEGVVVDNYDDNGNFTGYTGVAAQSAELRKATYGSNAQFDGNISMNIGDKLFLGLSVGIYSIDYQRESYYAEVGTDGLAYDFSNYYETSGDGFDVKLGAIVRPFGDSPFRIGAHIHTPIWYHMTDINGSSLYINNQSIDTQSADPFDYAYRTPWEFGISLGHTIGNCFAIGAEYSYSDLSTAKYYTDDWNEDSYFRNVNIFTKESLKGQSTFKIGVEYKPVSEFSVRFGYNYVSSPFKDDAYRVIAYDSYFTETDFTNWKATNRFTVGLGYRYKSGYVDLAYQYSAQKGDLYAFDDIDLKPTKIDNNRSQLMCTFGFRF